MSSFITDPFNQCTMDSPQSSGYFISRPLDQFFLGVYDIFRFILLFFKEAFVPPYELQEVIRQCYLIGYKSLPLITLTGFITGIVFTDHSRPALADFGATSWLPSISGSAVIKALAPLVTSMICAGKVGSQIGAELGSMKVTDQIDAMEVSGINPFKYLVVTRVIATTIMIPILVMYSAFVGLMGSFINIHFVDEASFATFINNAFFKVGFREIASSLTRSFVFGFTIGIISCFQGFTTTKGTEGVGRAANTAVVLSLFVIFLEEISIVKIFIRE
jgi:phospholipid/cholesterol/gamma-HCH transport system permease protein